MDPADVPFYPPPPGIESNFKDPNSLAPGAIAAISVFFSFMIIVVFMRIYYRVRVARSVGLDDWLAVFALFFTTGLTALTLHIFALNWLGPHSWDVPLSIYVSPAYNNILFTIYLLAVAAGCTIKASIFLFLLRLFPRRAAPKAAYVIWAGLIVDVLTNVGLFLAYAIPCAPRDGVIPAQCSFHFREVIGTATAAVNAGLDILALAVAVPSIWALNMQTKKKIACGSSLAVLYFRAATDPMIDPIRNQTAQVALGTIEPTLGLITACLPALPGLWIEVVNKSSGSMRGLLSRFRTTTSSFHHSEHGDRDQDKGFRLEDRTSDRFNKSSRSLPRHTVTSAAADVDEMPMVRYDTHGPDPFA
ncbi:hypothetical protein HD806DRAFT_444964 [Xylariaceae sp. AK1471]|nr:hypothetical protein HD806DRAFT_444964 [Xylariaceae sp. AK1471]